MLRLTQKTAVRSRFKVLNRGHWVELVVVDIRSLCHQQRKLLQSYRVSLWQLQSARNIPKHRGNRIMHQPSSTHFQRPHERQCFRRESQGAYLFGTKIPGVGRIAGPEINMKLTKNPLQGESAWSHGTVPKKCLESNYDDRLHRRNFFASSMVGLGLEGFGMQILENPFR